jgi:hypothetical protein
MVQSKQANPFASLGFQDFCHKHFLLLAKFSQKRKEKKIENESEFSGFNRQK